MEKTYSQVELNSSFEEGLISNHERTLNKADIIISDPQKDWRETKPVYMTYAGKELLN